MKKITSLSFLLAGALAIVSCGSNTGYQKTKSGLMYKIISSTKDSVVKEGNVLQMNYTVKISRTDSVLATSYGKMPAFVKVFPAQAGDQGYNPNEVFPLLHKGDSVVVVQLVDTIMKRQGGNLPPFLKKGDQIVSTFKVIDVFTSDEKAKIASDAEMQKEKNRLDAETATALVSGVKEMEEWLAKKNIKAQKTGRGVFVVVNEPGTGMQADSGLYVSVRYAGKKLADGVEFESNMKPDAQPYTLMLGVGQVIAGWDEGLKLFKKGGKGTLYIPGALAYGNNPPPGSPFKPNEALIFDVEMVDVTDKQPTPPGMPQMPMPDTTSKR